MRFFIVFTLLLTLFDPTAFAQNAKQVFLNNINVESVTTLSGTNAQSQKTRVSLWGIKPITENNRVAGQIALEDIIAQTPINCTIKRWITAQDAQGQCIGHKEKDIALSLIERGYAMADRQAITNSVFNDIYKNAELSARKSRSGLWKIVIPEESEFEQLIKKKSETFQLTQNTAYVLIIAIIFGPFIGMLIVGGIIYKGFQRLLTMQKYQIASAAQKDKAMREREKFIVAASLEGEMNTNRAKLDAFIIIYEELLKNLRDPLKDHKYKKGGDIIHKKPALSRNVYDTNIDKIDVLGQQTVTELSNLYVSIEPNPAYKTIEPSTPIEEVIAFVDSIVQDAEAMLAPIDHISASLNVIVRDKRAKGKNV